MGALIFGKFCISGENFKKRKYTEKILYDLWFFRIFFLLSVKNMVN